MKNKDIRRIKLPFFILAFLILYGCSPSSQSEKGAVDFKEAVGYRPVSQPDWEGVPAGINVSFGSTDERYGKYAVPTLVPKTKWTGTAWKGERASAQAVIWSADGLEEVRCTSSDLVTEDGDILAGESIHVFFIRYVVTDEFGKGGGKRNTADYDTTLVADILDPVQEITMEHRTTRPVWIAVDVPRTSAAGDYSGTITIEAKGVRPAILDVKLKVIDKTLPSPSNWAFHLDLWQNPFAVACYYQVDLWSKEHFDLLRPLMEMLAGAGQKCITTSIVDKTWGGQTYDPFDSMIKWIKTKDGNLRYDYSIFDNWVDFMMGCGITDQISCYSMLPTWSRIAYYDESIQKDTVVKALAGTELYKEYWTPFLKQFVIHLKEKGWLDKTVIAMDEREPEDMQQAIALVHDVSPGMKIALAGNFHPEINDDLYDLCAYIKNDFPGADLVKRQEKGQNSTYYVCCSPEYPNTFTFSPPYEATFIGWYAAAKGFDGFLRWAYNSWVKAPLMDSRFRKWPAGDTYMVYPGPRSSIRFERLREGIQDYEKIRLLKDELMHQGTAGSAEQVQQLDSLLKTCDWQDAGHMQEFVNKGKKLLGKLSGDE